MKIQASISTGIAGHDASVSTHGVRKSVSIPVRDGAPGSSLNGGELLLLAVATCFGNDLFREAGPRDIVVVRADVEVNGEFGGVGEPARHIIYSVQVEAHATEGEIAELIQHTDRVAEVHNTLRLGLPVTLASFRAIPVSE